MGTAPKSNIQCVSDAYLCSACGACVAACSKDAITFEWSVLGRKYSHVDIDKCIECGLCLKVCPSLDFLELHKRYENKYEGNIIKTFIGKATDDFIYRNAQSGGVCTAIISYLFETGNIDGAVLCKMEVSSNPRPEGVLIESLNEIYSCQKSSYTPVDVLSVLKKAKSKKSIAVVGLPCHIQGATLLSETISSFSNIKYKIGLICDRTICAGFQEVLLSYVPHGNKIIQWRKKDFTYKNHYYSYKDAPVVFMNDKEGIVKGGIFAPTYRYALKDFFTSPRCRVCYDKLNTHADIVLGDPWGMSDVDWDHGESVVIARTKKGEDIIYQMLNDKKLVLKEQNNFNEIIKGQHIDDQPSFTACYSEAIKIIPQKIKSYLYELNIDAYYTDSKLSRAKESITSFISHEKLSHRMVIREGRSVINESHKRPTLYKRIIIKLSLIKHKLKK